MAEVAPRLRRDPHLPFQEIEGRVVIVSPARREVHELDEVGTFLWNELEEPRTLSQLVEAVCRTYDVEAGRAVRDIRGFLDLLEERRLLSPE
jgi:hypothetical protein